MVPRTGTLHMAQWSPEAGRNLGAPPGLAGSGPAWGRVLHLEELLWKEVSYHAHVS